MSISIEDRLSQVTKLDADSNLALSDNANQRAQSNSAQDNSDSILTPVSAKHSLTSADLNLEMSKPFPADSKILMEYFVGAEAEQNILKDPAQAARYFLLLAAHEGQIGDGYEYIKERVSTQAYHAMFIAPLDKNPALDPQSEAVKAILITKEEQRAFIIQYPELARQFYENNRDIPVTNFWHQERNLGADQYFAYKYSREILLQDPVDFDDVRIPKLKIPVGQLIINSNEVGVVSSSGTVKVNIHDLRSGDEISLQETPSVENKVLFSRVGQASILTNRGNIKFMNEKGSESLRIEDNSPYIYSSDGQPVVSAIQLGLVENINSQIEVSFNRQSAAVKSLSMKNPVQIKLPTANATLELRPNGSAGIEYVGRDLLDQKITLVEGRLSIAGNTQVTQRCDVEADTETGPLPILRLHKDEVLQRLITTKISNLDINNNVSPDREYDIAGFKVNYHSTRVNSASFSAGYEDAQIIVDSSCQIVALQSKQNSSPIEVALFDSDKHQATPVSSAVASNGMKLVLGSSSALLIKEAIQTAPKDTFIANLKFADNAVQLVSDGKGSIKDIGIGEIIVDEQGKTVTKPAHKGSIAQELEDRNIQIKLVDGALLRTNLEQTIAKLYPQVVNCLTDAIDKALPQAVVLDPKNNVYKIEKLGVFGGEINLTYNNEIFEVRAKDVGKEAVGTVLTMGAKFVPFFDETRTVLEDMNDPQIKLTKTVEKLKALGWQDDGIEALRGNLGELISRLEVPGIVINYLKDQKIDFSETELKDLSVKVVKSTVPGQKQAIEATIELAKIKVEGALPAGAVGRFAGDAVGIGSGLVDITEDIDHSLSDIPVINIASKIVTGPFWLLGQGSRAAKTATHLSIGESVTDCKLELTGYMSEDGKWTITRKPVQVAFNK